MSFVTVPDTGLQLMECNIPTESSIIENVDIIWMTIEGTVVQTVKNVLGYVDGDKTMYRDTLLRRKNDSTAYNCQLRVNSNPSLSQLGRTGGSTVNACYIRQLWLFSCIITCGCIETSLITC